MTYSKIFKSYITKTNNVSKFIFENRADLIASCQEQVACFEGEASMQEKYSALAELGYKFTLELNSKGKWVRKHSVANEWTAIKWIAENSQVVSDADLDGKKIMGLRGLMSACKPKPTVETTLEGEAEETAEVDEYDTPVENLRVDAQLGRKRSFAELLKNFQDIVQAQGDEWNAFLDFAMDDEGAKISEGETCMSK